MQIELSRHDVRPGESWVRAAERLAGPLPGPLLAVDLSGDPLVFGTSEDRFAMRPMTRGDLTEVGRWIRAPHVARWWDGRDQPDQVAKDFGPGIDGEEPTRYWIWEVNGRSVGFSQDYRICDHPEFALLCGSPAAIGFDYAIGEAAFAGRGLGTSLLWVYLRDIVAPAYADSDELFAAPDHRNLASLRVLAKLGASQGLWFDEPNGRERAGRHPAHTVIGCSIDTARVLR